MASEQQLGNDFTASGGLPFGDWLSRLYGAGGVPADAAQPAAAPDLPSGVPPNLPRITVTPQQGPPQPWQGQSPRVKPAPQDNIEAFGDTLANLVREPSFKEKVFSTLNRGAQWVADTLGPAVPPELRSKGQAALQAADMVNPATMLRDYTMAAKQGHYGEAALNMAGLIPGEGVAAGLAKLAGGAKALPAMLAGVGANRAMTISPRAEDIARNRMVTYASGKPQLVDTGAGKGFHDYSATKTTTKPVEEMTGQLENVPTLDVKNVPPDKVLKEGQEIIFAAGDRTNTGGDLTHVGDVKLTKPIKQEGGANFAMAHQGKPVEGLPSTGDNAAQLIWGNAASAASRMVNLGNAVKERTGMNPLMAFSALGKSSMSSSKQVADTVLDLAQQAKITGKGRTMIDDFMRDVAGHSEFPGFNKKGFEEWWQNASGAKRSSVVDALDRKMVRLEGGPDVGEARIVNTDPRLYNTPTGGSGLTMSTFDPSLGTVPSGHSTYSHGLLGYDPVSLGGSVPFHILGRDIAKGLHKFAPEDYKVFANRPDYYLLQGMPQGVPVTQRVDQRLIDAVSKWHEKQLKEHGSLWSVGAPVAAGAAASRFVDPSQFETR
jgi:hypothetical protein